MRLHWVNQRCKVMVALIVIGVAVVSTAAVGLAGEKQARGDPALTGSATPVPDVAKSPAQDAGNLQFTIFTSRGGTFSFEVPSTWTTSPATHDPMREAFFVGPTDQARHLAVFLTVSRYPTGTTSASPEDLIAQLKLDRNERVVISEPLLIDNRPARLLTFRGYAAVPGWTTEPVDLALCESVALIADGGDIYLLEYVSSPELYSEYLLIFDRLVRSFHFHHETPSQRMIEATRVVDQGP